ncbi:MAG TPA: GrpB family protein [Ignavibacteria bacterium]|nr:GrpB family protein [Ignavibacteria bacterium]
MKIVIKEYQKSWNEDFLKLKDEIQSALRGMKITVDHIGSTSVNGLGAKPIIDILVGVEKETELDKTIQPMQNKGFTYHKKYERVSEKWTAWPERRYFIKLKSVDALTPPLLIDFDDEINDNFIKHSHIHTLVKDTNAWKRHIAFRDYLRNHSNIRDEYYLLKKEISKQEFENGLKYNEAKNDYVKEIERKAMKWYNENN